MSRRRSAILIRRHYRHSRARRRPWWAHGAFARRIARFNLSSGAAVDHSALASISPPEHRDFEATDRASSRPTRRWSASSRSRKRRPVLSIIGTLRLGDRLEARVGAHLILDGQSAHYRDPDVGDRLFSGRDRGDRCRGNRDGRARRSPCRSDGTRTGVSEIGRSEVGKCHARLSLGVESL